MTISDTKQKSNIPVATHSGVLRIAGKEIRCAVFEKDGEVKRVLLQRAVVKLFTNQKRGNFAPYLKPENLRPFLPEKFKTQSPKDVLQKVYINGKIAYAYEGEDIVDLCNMYIQAREHLHLPQIKFLVQAELIVTSLAKVGIVGLIDEATGYQNIRQKDALQAYLEKVINKELAAWVKRFPDEFFKQIFRLNKWETSKNGPITSRGPRVIGKYINNVVYQRLGPGILDELEKLNPSDDKSQRRNRHHQWLTPDVGHLALAQHLHAIIGLMKASETWEGFMKLLDIAFPKQTIEKLLQNSN